MKSVKFAELDEEEYSKWLKHAIEDYAQEKAKAGNFKKENALESSRKEFEGLLPKGRFSEDNYLYTIQDQETHRNVGVIWFKTKVEDPKAAFIYDIEIKEDLRGNGYGAAALLLLEQEVKKFGKSKISLHVFGHNANAIRLYERLGYATTNILMSKVLEPDNKATS